MFAERPRCRRIEAASLGSHPVTCGAATALLVHAQVKETTMNWDRIQLDWMHFKDQVRGNWVKLTDEDVTRIGGRREQLIGRLQARYGFAKAEAAREVEAWMRSQRRAA
jgi:uncharacterized protein YjbJ (UPF0337 family)